MNGCIAPDGRGGICGRPRALAREPFCGAHVQAAPGQKGGWISAYRRKRAMADAGDHGTPLDASKVYPLGGAPGALYVGAAPPTDRALAAFSMIVLCAREVQPLGARWAATKVVRVPLPDAELTQAEITHAVTAARMVANELARGGRVLVTCRLGINRSALVAAMAMLMRSPRMLPDDAIARIRLTRNPNALGNPHFVEYLRRIWSSRRR